MEGIPEEPRRRTSTREGKIFRNKQKTDGFMEDNQKCVCAVLRGFHRHILVFPFVYQFELQIELEPNLLVQNPVELIISPTFQIVLISCVT